MLLFISVDVVNTHFESYVSYTILFSFDGMDL
jgi:hypothetical protein